jgi:hypothetical protein
MRLIALAGYATVGKDAICESLGFQRCAFADALKADLPPLLSKLPPHEKYQIRPLLVEYGRTARRLDPDYWVKRLIIPKHGDVCCVDVRYANECRYIQGLGGIIIRVHRAGVGPANEEEERTIGEIDRQFRLPSVSNDGSLSDAARKVWEIIHGHKDMSR